MAAGDPWIGCSEAPGVIELLNALGAKITATGVEGLRVHITTTAAANVSNAISCSGSNDDVEVWLGKKLVEGADGKAALHLIVTT